jgi:cytochrome c oxidase accessory protein FixG
MSEPVNAAPADIVEPPLYEARKDVFQQSVKGRYRTIKWIVLCATLAIYYFLPFVRWYRGPNAPDQAVLIDFNTERFYFFFIEIWPQELYYVTGLLILAALTLFLMNAIAGRVWCGYLCPQTVWTDLFYAVERLIEGDRREQIAKASGGWTLERFAEKLLKHSIWLMVAWWTGGAWVLYFADAPTLVRKLATFQAEPIFYIWILILTFTTYTLAGFMREQVCLYMCPWPRIQAALTDEEALNVMYRYDRGEPRMSLKKSEVARKNDESAGDCIDCHQCVAVCPTGVDIRHGSQLGCIQCGLCIDACNSVMVKIGRPEGLIGYDTDANALRRERHEEPHYRIVRPRTIIYAVVIAVTGSLMLYTLLSRSTLGISALHDRNPLFVKLADGSIRNAYTIRLTNKMLDPRVYRLTLSGPPAARLEAVGVHTQDGTILAEVAPDQTLELRVLVTLPKAALEGDKHSGSHEGRQDDESLYLTFNLMDLASGAQASVSDFFKAPGN